MSYGRCFLLLLLLLYGIAGEAQKPFAEGTIKYKVRLQAGDQKALTGVYSFTIKGGEIRKELRLNNGYQDIVLLDCSAGKAYSLQNRYGKKYAVQLSINDMLKRQEKFNGYTIKDEEYNNKYYAGYASYKGNVNYNDGSSNEVLYTKDWRPTQAITFERFPDAKFIPVLFSYKDENNMEMEFEVEKIEPGPIDNAIFRIPADYQMISYSEYRQLSK